jgi:hypothetical protein
MLLLLFMIMRYNWSSGESHILIYSPQQGFQFQFTTPDSRQEKSSKPLITRVPIRAAQVVWTKKQSISANGMLATSCCWGCENLLSDKLEDTCTVDRMVWSDGIHGPNLPGWRRQLAARIYRMLTLRPDQSSTATSWLAHLSSYFTGWWSGQIKRTE